MAMRLVEYIYNPNNGTYGIDLGYTPTNTTNVRIKGMAVPDGGLYFGTGPEGAPTDSWLRFFSYSNGQMTLDSPNDSSERIDITFDNSADFFDISFGYYGNNNIYIENNLTGDRNYSGAYAPNFSTTLKCWGNGNYNNQGGSRFYEIWIYEGNVLQRHYNAAFDDVQGAGLYEENTQTFYGSVAGGDPISYQDLPPVHVNAPGVRNYIPASGGSLSGSVVINTDLSQNNYYMDISLFSSIQSAATLTVSGQPVSYFSASTAGTYPFTVTFPAWDGSGAVDNRGRRRSTYMICLRDSQGVSQSVGNLPYSLGVWQNSPSGGTPLIIGDLESTTIYLGDDDVMAMYLGDDLVFGS